MRIMLRILVPVFGVAMLAGAELGEAQQKILPTGTPTIVPKKSTAAPTPRPLSKAEVDARNLGSELARIDAATWGLVRSLWRDAATCLAAVEAYLDGSVDELKRLIRTSAVMECVDDPNTGRKRLRLTTDEARDAFLEGYGDAAESLRSLRKEFENEPAGAEVLEAARDKQSSWQDSACRQLDAERVPRKSGKPVEVPARSTSKKGSS